MSSPNSNQLSESYVKPAVINLRKCTLQNPYFRSALWTGENLQVTVMCIPCGEAIGLECHDHLDQLLYIEQGFGIVCMGKSKENLSYQKQFCSGSSILVPSGTWHNIYNKGNCPLKLFSVYAPPEHPECTIHKTAADAEEYENPH